MAHYQPEIQPSSFPCPNCAKPVSGDSPFCMFCGHSTPNRPQNCVKCGASPNPGDRFCSKCGTAIGMSYAGFWIRFGASLIDNFIKIVLFLLVLATPVAFLGLITFLGYELLFMVLRRPTLGKMSLRLIVVNADGDAPSIGRLFLREYIGKFISTIALMLGFIWIGLDSRKRGWHDYIGGTYVVHKTAMQQTDDAV